MEEVAAVPDAVSELAGAEAPRRGEDVDRLQQARLAGAVAAEEQVRAPRGLPGEGLQVAEAGGGELDEHRRRLSVDLGVQPTGKPSYDGARDGRGRPLPPL